MHQRSCRTFRLLQEQHRGHQGEDNSPQDSLDSSLQDSVDGSVASELSEITNVHNLKDPIATKSGIKLPRSKQQWEEANLYFKLHIDSTENITDIHGTTRYIQEMIYNYFAINYGVIKSSSNSDFSEKYKNHLTKALKRALAKLKGSHLNTQEIIFVSKLLRQKLKNGKTSEEKDPTIESRLRKAFWKTCKAIYNSGEKISPTFSLQDCFSYFKDTLAKSMERK